MSLGKREPETQSVLEKSKGMFLPGRARREHHGTHPGATAGACLLFPEAVSEEDLRAFPVCNRNVRVAGLARVHWKESVTGW